MKTPVRHRTALFLCSAMGLVVFLASCRKPAAARGPAVDPALVGTWEQTVTTSEASWALTWEIAADGDYLVHIEGRGSPPGHKGKMAAADGSWTLAASDTDYTDGGTYVVRDADTFVGIGKLGPGTWTRRATARPGEATGGLEWFSPEESDRMNREADAEAARNRDKIQWLTDFDQAMMTAQLAGLPLVICFTGGVNLDAVLYSDESLPLNDAAVLVIVSSGEIDPTKDAARIEEQFEVSVLPEFVLAKVIGENEVEILLSVGFLEPFREKLLAALRDEEAARNDRE